MDTSHDSGRPAVAGVVTAMTDDERPYLREAVEAVLSDPGIHQCVLCIEEHNTWAETELDGLWDDPRLEVVRTPMAYAGAVRNRALAHVRTPWVAYCDGDDVWYRGKTLAQLELALRTGADFVGADHCLTDERGEVRAYALARYLPMLSTWLVRTKVMRAHPFDEQIDGSTDIYEDAEWWKRTRSLRKVRCPNVFLRYRVRATSHSSTERSRQRKARVVALAGRPLLRFPVLIATWGIWWAGRRRSYRWLPSWDTAEFDAALARGRRHAAAHAPG